MLHNKVTKRKKTKLLIGAALGSALFLLLGIWLAFILVHIPTIDDFKNRQVSESTKIYDQTGKNLLWEIHGEENRTTVPFDKISINVKNATIAIEDRYFYTHKGFQPISLLRSALYDLSHGKSQGGSTITQQLVKQTLLTSEKTFTRKIKELIIAIKLERVYSKDQILNLYLNEIPYGSNAYGIETAAQIYFGKSAADVSIAEAAYLASMPQAPTHYSPYGNYRQDLENRKNLVLQQMKDQKFITEQEYTQAKNEKVVFLPQQRRGLRAPHFVMYVRELLNEKYGEDVVDRGGLQVTTTLDSDLQQKAEDVISKRAPELQTKFNASNAALVAVDPKTGRILSMVGSRDYFDISHEGNFNVTLAHRQPGSTFKPIVYATAFKKGFTPETVVFDLETNFSTNNTPYIPQNYDDKFRGPVTLREALAQSLNVPSVETLYLAGIDNALETARDMGISTLTNKNQYGLTLVLGGGEVSPLEMTAAYGVFANQGVKADTHAIIQVKDKDGNVLEEEKNSTQQVLDANIANLITSILTDNKARTPAFGANSPLYFSENSVAAKTGTTNDYRDVWTIGYTPNLVVGAWAGNNNNSSMTKNVAGYIIAPLWRDFMEQAIASRDKESFIPPTPQNPQKPVLRGIWRGSRNYFIDKNSGKLATLFTPDSQKEERIIQQIHSILYWVDKNNPDGPIPSNPGQDPQFQNWERAVREWAQKMNLQDEDSSIPITEQDSSHSPENWPKITLPPDEENKTFSSDEIVFHPTITSTYGISKIDIFIDGDFLKSENGTISSVTIQKNTLLGNENPHTLTLKVYDSIGNHQDKDISFTILAP